ncbi:MAG: alkaline phosphatase family protein [Abditibacteriota bacterium]|nr:alkaline phosphatase family protein [Abditibacteriota bacterium]
MNKLICIILFIACSVCLAAYDKANPGSEKKHFVYKHVVFIGVDGLGAFHLNTDTPNIDRLFVDGGASTCRAEAVKPTISGENWTSIFTGVLPYYHKVGNHNIDSRAYAMGDKYPTVFALVDKAFPGTVMGSFVDWPSLNKSVVDDLPGVEKFNTSCDKEADVCKVAEAFIKEHKPVFTFVYFGNPDHMGHAGGYLNEPYYEAVRAMDGYVGRVVAAVEDAGIADDTLILITTDHGGVKNGGHGGFTDEETFVFFGVKGKTVIKGSDLGHIYTRDLPAVVCYALGIKGNPLWDAFLPDGLFEEYPKPHARKAEQKPKKHKSLATPAADSPEGLYNYIDRSKLRSAFCFDGSLEPLAGSYKAEFNGEEKYGDGMFGKALWVNVKNFVSVPELTFGKDSFSVSMWLNARDYGVNQPTIFGNKDWRSGFNTGFIVASLGAFKFNLGNGSDARCDYMYTMPYDFPGRWTNVIIAADREQGVVRAYINFEEVGADTLSAALRDVSFDSGLPFTIGCDGSRKTISSMDFLADDLLVFDGALSSEEVSRLGEYYRQR